MVCSLYVSLTKLRVSYFSLSVLTHWIFDSLQMHTVQMLQYSQKLHKLTKWKRQGHLNNKRTAHRIYVCSSRYVKCKAIVYSQHTAARAQGVTFKAQSDLHRRKCFT